MFDLSVYATQALHGVVSGMLLFLVASGLTLKAWETSKFKAVWGAEVEMRACDHQMLTQGYVAEVMEPDKIPADLCYFGTDFPYLGKAVLLPKDELTIPPKETGNKRCA